MKRVPATLSARLNKQKKANGKLDEDLARMALSSSSISSNIFRILSIGVVTPMSGLPEVMGFSLPAEFISFSRYLSHFRSIHKGSSKLTGRSIAPRKLHPAGWGFICPVHTPDGTPCGLLLHLTANCKVQESPLPEEDHRILRVLYALGVVPMNIIDLSDHSQLSVSLNGVPVGMIPNSQAAELAHNLRLKKVFRQDVPENLEIIFIAKSQTNQFPGLFLFSNMGRLVREVFNLEAQKKEWIGIGEQPFLNIALTPKDVSPEYSHQELSITSIFSVLANCTPLCDFNQSPRNIYQCQVKILIFQRRFLWRTQL